MAFKVKNPFIHKHTASSQRTLGRDGRIISPVRQNHDLDPRDPMSQDYKDAIAAGDKADPRLVGALDDPRNAEEYYGSFDINPNLELANPSLMDKGVKFLYDNPIIGKVAKTNPISKFLYKKGTEFMMNKSGGQGGGFDQEDIEFNEKYYQEQETDLLNKLKAGSITKETYDKEMSNVRPAGYTGGDKVAWRDEDINLVQKYLGGDGGGLIPQTRYKPKSDDYEWLDTYSMKKGFDQNLDRIDLNSGFEGTNNEDGVEIWAEDALTGDTLYKNSPRSFKDNFPAMVENVMDNTEIFYDDEGNMSKKGFDPDKSTKENFMDLYKGKTFYGDGQENPQINRNYFGTDLGGARLGLGADGKLPYMSAWDAWDFQSHGEGGWSKKWAEGELGQNLSSKFYSKEMDEAKRDYMQSQLLNRASRDLGGKGGFKVYDRFYFTPDKYKDYIKDKDVDFMKEFYDVHHAGDESTWQEPVVINASKKKK